MTTTDPLPAAPPAPRPIPPILMEGRKDIHAIYHRTQFHLWQVALNSMFREDRRSALDELVRERGPLGDEFAAEIMRHIGADPGELSLKLLECLVFENANQDSWKLWNEMHRESDFERTRRLEQWHRTVQSLAYAISFAVADESPHSTSTIPALSRIVCNRVKRDPFLYWAVPAMPSFMRSHIAYLQEAGSLEEKEWNLLDRWLLAILAAEDVTLIDVCETALELTREKFRQPWSNIDKLDQSTREYRVKECIARLRAIRKAQNPNLGRAIAERLTEEHRWRKSSQLMVRHPLKITRAQLESGEPIVITLETRVPGWMLQHWSVGFRDCTNLLSTTGHFSDRDEPVQFSLIPRSETNRFVVSLTAWDSDKQRPEEVVSYSGYIVVE